ncbi:hypothetical protein ACFWDI_18080 [Streptomyces sp. NPDC060064]|uniref:hypothetical protein n=1 Tax=Streptomyces sp. NPDC060064 TaxID=3347049 RepID=UPI0036C39CE4
MLRHVIAPARFFSQVPNEIIRHPRLSSDAVRLLTWQLSLPKDADEPLSKTAERAGIKKIAFLRAKQQLKAEGFLHEWREQADRGRWRTRQLVSNVPLSAEEAAHARDGSPTVREPAAGEPIARAVGRHPEKIPPGNTSNPPAAPTEAHHVVEQIQELDRRLRVPRAMLPELAALAAQWLACGHTAETLRAGVRRSLPAPGTPIPRPGGLLRYVLRDVPPVDVTPEPRVARMRECGGEHTQPRLFRPVADEELCPECRQGRAETPAAPLPATRGAALARAAMTGAWTP